METDRDLLRRFAESNCEEAFAELVRRHVNLVYSAALRQVNGDSHLAQDVAQSVFVDLARKAASLWRRPGLTGWLYTSTHFAATNAIRTESRRRAHEQEAHDMHELLRSHVPALDWDRVSPELDRAMHELKESDRALVLLRYFQNRRFAQIGESLGLTEEAARKRVERALERLRASLCRRGITTTAALSAALSAKAIQSAPTGLAGALSAGALAGLAGKAAVTATVTKTLAMTTLQKTLIVAALAALAGTGMYQARRASILQGRLEGLQQQEASLSQQLDRSGFDNKVLSNQLAQAIRSASVQNDRLRELLKLRGEVGVLRQRQRELERTLTARGTDPHGVIEPQPGTPAPFQLQLVADGPRREY